MTSASNESSVVLYAISAMDAGFLLTGDAGIKGVDLGGTYARAQGYTLQNFNCVQIPHHGSRRNVGPKILN